MMGFYSKHYITIDAQNRITSGWSDGPHPEKDAAGAVCLSEQGGYQFRLFPGGEENPTLYTMDGIPLYRWDGQAAQRRTEEELAADHAAIPTLPQSPTTSERLDALENALLAVMGGIDNV